MGKSEQRQAVVCDAGPLIHLHELNSLELLAEFSPVLVPAQVWDEVARHRPQALELEDRLDRVPVDVSAVPPFLALVQALALDLGEQAALSLMQQHPDAILLTDDAAARIAANTLGFKVHGTIGILIRAVRRDQRQPHEIVEVLEELPQRSTLYIRPALLQVIIARLRQMTG
jgi:predicted nucleic acid-binding protein